MLSSSYLASCSDDITKLYSQLEHDISVSIASHLAKMGEVTDLISWQMKIAKETGTLQQDISRYLDKYNAEAQTKIKKLYQEAMEKNKANDTHFVKEANRELSDTQETVLKTAFARFLNASKINKDYSRMQTKYSADAIFNSIKRQTLTIADTSEKAFIEQANAAYMKVATGAFDSQTAIKDSITNLAKQDIETVSYSQSSKPVKRSIEAAVRSNVMTGINQSASQQTLQNLEELGSDLVEVDAHLGARNRDVPGRPWANHSEWQGKIYSLSGTNPDYPPFSECGLGEPDGICGINCRHSFYPYFEGMDPEYSDGELSEMKDPKVTYNGEEISQYEAEQTLRGFERNIRKYKKQADCLEAGGIDNTKAKDMMKQYQSYARDLCKQTGINRDYTREFVGKQNKNEVYHSDKTVDTLNKQQKIDKEKLKRIQTAVKKNGFGFEVGEDTDRWLESKGVEGVTFCSGDIMLHTKASASGTFEELIHQAQTRRHNFQTVSYKQKCLDEIEAKEKLLKYYKSYGITEYEKEVIQEDLDRYRKALEEL